MKTLLATARLWIATRIAPIQPPVVVNPFDACEFAPLPGSLRPSTYRLTSAFRWLLKNATKNRLSAAAEYRILRQELGHDRARQFLVSCSNYR